MPRCGLHKQSPRAAAPFLSVDFIREMWDARITDLAYALELALRTVEMVNVEREKDVVKSQKSLSTFFGRSLQVQMCRDIEHEENWTEDTCEGGIFSKPRIEKKEALVRQCTQKNCRILDKHGQDMDIVLIEKEACVFDLHLSQ